jgi:hypothetical protein
MQHVGFFIDLHCHPQYKPFGKAHKQIGNDPEPPSPRASDKTSVWQYDPPNLPDKLLNYWLELTRFRQTNLTAAHYGEAWVLVAGLGTVEQGFMENKLDKRLKFAGDLIDNLASQFGNQRIKTIESMTNYYPDLLNEINFWKAGHNKVVRVDGQYLTYRITQNFAQLQEHIAANQHEKAGTTGDQPLIISVVFSVEGMHAFGTGLDNEPDEDQLTQRIIHLKQSPEAPFFITFAHHFWNHLCGHARSLRGLIGKVTDQENGIDSPFAPLGEKMLRLLLDPSRGRRILIDMKHMSAVGRRQLIKWRKENYQSSFPLIISHGVCNGLPSLEYTDGFTPETAALLGLQPPFPANRYISNHPLLGKDFITPLENEKDASGRWKDHNLINFFDDEILAVAESDGIIGIQLDERRLANDDALRRVKNSLRRHKIMHYRSELVWRQIQYIGELLDHHGHYAWGCMAIGSDYDGLVNPVNGFWTVEEYRFLMDYLERHAHNYFKHQGQRLKQERNRIAADELVENIAGRNAYGFMRRYF